MFPHMNFPLLHKLDQMKAEIKRIVYWRENPPRWGTKNANGQLRTCFTFYFHRAISAQPCSPNESPAPSQRGFALKNRRLRRTDTALEFAGWRAGEG
jgi:hypothetical protein